MELGALEPPPAPPRDAAPGRRDTLAGVVIWAACDDTCEPPLRRSVRAPDHSGHGSKMSSERASLELVQKRSALSSDEASTPAGTSMMASSCAAAG